MSDDIHDVLRRAVSHSTEYLDTLQDSRVGATASTAELRRRLGGPLGETGELAEQVIDELASNVEGGLFTTGGGRFFAWAIGGALPASLGADWLASAWDQNSVIYGTSPAMAVIEEVAGEWLKELLGLPPQASYAFVTGCQLAHVTALAAARHKLLNDLGHDVGARGLSGAPRIVIRTGELCHESVLRASRLLGLGTDAVVTHPCRPDGRTDLDDIERALSDEGDAPTILVLQAGEFNTGAFDDFHRAHQLKQGRNMWVHVDGALGLFAAASERTRPLMAGCSLLDSWATDGHKWLNVPFDCGYVFVAHPEAHKEAMTVRASYFTASDDVRHQIDWTPEWSRRGRAVPTYAALRSLGRQGLARLLDRSCELCLRLVEGIGALDGAEVVARPVINQGLVRFTSPDGDHDRRTDEVVERLQLGGEAWFGAATFLGRRVMRAPVLSWRTTEADVDRAIEAVRRALDVSG
jgi:glutamate/tyrosine decarboxylase-like PLP-dependent enzyme